MPKRPSQTNLLARSAVEDLIGGPLWIARSGEEVDEAILILRRVSRTTEALSAATWIGYESHAVTGRPDSKRVARSYVQRPNLTIRTSMRRLARLTDGFSKKLEIRDACVALNMMFYIFGQKHTTLGTTPAVTAGIANHVWSVE